MKSGAPGDDAGPGWPLATIALLLCCIWVFVWRLTLGEAGFDRASHAFGVIPAVLSGRATLPPDLQLIAPPWTLFVSLFFHGSVLLLAANLAYLWVFGRAVEHALEHGRFIVLFSVCGTFAALAQAIDAPLSTLPVIGAGGAVSGVLGAYLLLNPRARLVVRILSSARGPRLYVPAVAPIVVWFVFNFAVGVNALSGLTGLSWPAHLTGLVSGGVLMLFLKRRDAALFN